MEVKSGRVSTRRRSASRSITSVGYLRGHAVGRYYREVKVQAIGGGSKEVMRDLAASQMEP